MRKTLRPLMFRTLITWAIGMTLWFCQQQLSGARWPDQALFRVLSSIFFPAYQLRAGDGSHAHTFQLSKLQDSGASQPFLVNTTEDPERTFDSHPLSPSDLAVLLHTLQRNGTESVVLGAPHAWDDADPFAIDALEMVCAQFRNCITSAPVGRSVGASYMPAAFLRAAIPSSSVKGNISRWPIVNRISMPNCYLGKEHTWAGFSQVESEENTAQHSFLVARWGDQIIFSNALLALLCHENVQPSQLEIIAGDSIRLPRQGCYIPIDDYGRIQFKQTTLPAADLLADQLIRPDPKNLAILGKHTEPIHILDQSSEISSAEREIQQHIHQTLLALYQSPHIARTMLLPRLPAWGEILLLAILALQFVTIYQLERKTQGIALLLLLVLALLAIRIGHTWLPLFPSLAMLGHCILWRNPAVKSADPSSELRIEFLPSRKNATAISQATALPEKQTPATTIAAPALVARPKASPPTTQPIAHETKTTKSAAPSPTQKSLPARKKAKKSGKNPRKP